MLENTLSGTVGFATSGACIELTNGPVILFATLANLLSDGDGHRMAFDWRGASGMKPCLKHYNVFKKEL